MSSTLLYEDEDWIIVEDYVHDDPDSFDTWEYETNPDQSIRWEGKQRFEWYYQSIYEAQIYMQIDKRTGEHYLIRVEHGDIVLEPV